MRTVSGLSSILQTPAVRAFLLQVLAFFATLVVLSVAEIVIDGETPLPVWAALQGAFAALLSRWSRLAKWWVVIQLFFPGFVLAAQAIHLPPLIFLGIFVVLLTLYWTTFRTQVPFFPSTRTTWEAVAKLLPQGGPIHFVDIGSGFGGLVLHLAALRPDSCVSGVELAPLPWFVSRMRAGLARSRGQFFRRDYLELNLADYDVVFAFLSPAAMPALWEKAREEMRKGSLLLSYEFPISGATPEIVLPTDDRGASLYGWRM